MKTRLLTKLSILTILALLPFHGGTQASASSVIQENQVPQSIESKAQELTANLEAQGFEVSRGVMRLYTDEDCPYSFAEMATCYGNNPAAPYVTFRVPPWPKEYLDPATDEAWGQKVEGLSTSYRFDPREAIVILGLLPPPADYFGLQTYLFTRQGVFDMKSVPYQFFTTYYPDIVKTFFSKVPQNHKRVINFASLSNSINNVVIDRQSGAAFDQERFFIITPDAFMDRAMREALDEISIDPEDIFTEPIPGNMRTGLNYPSDDFITIIRYAMPADGGGDGTPSDLWRKNLPLVVLRIRDTTPGRKAERFPPVELETRTGNNELALKPDLLALARAVGQRWGQPCVDEACSNLVTPFLKVQLPPINMVGPQCTEIGMNCLGDTEDTVYQYTKTFVLNQDVVYAIAGTLGTQTDNATYVGLSLLATMRQLGFGNLPDEELLGTASAYDAAVNNTEQFFLYYFARDCSALAGLTDGNCREISEAELPPCDDPSSLTCDNLKFSVRDYIYPNTQRGAAALLKLNSLVITLQMP